MCFFLSFFLSANFSQLSKGMVTLSFYASISNHKFSHTSDLGKIA